MAMLIFSGCAATSTNSKGHQYLIDHYLNDPNTSDEIKAAIKSKKVIKGMCPLQAFAAAGFPGPYFVEHDRDKWGEIPDPPMIINMQCKEPDNSIIELKFHNATQYSDQGETTFRVKFVKGVAVLIDQKNFREE